MDNYLGLFLLITALVSTPYIVKIFKLPISIIEIIIGALLGYFSLYPDIILIDNLAIFGFYYLMFLVGMEINLENKKIEFAPVIIYLLILNIMSFLVVWLLNINYFYLMIFPLMSVGMLKILSKEYDEKWIKFALITGIIGEFLSIIILTILESFHKYGNKPELYYHILGFLGLLLVFGIFFIVVKKIFAAKPDLLKLIMPIQDTNSESFRVGFFLIILLIGIMDIFGFEMALGSFIAGFFVSNFFTHKEGLLVHRFSSLGFGIFIPIFFIDVGTNLNLDNFKDMYFLIDVFKIIFITIIIHLISVTIFFNKLENKEMFLFALSHSMPLTLLIVFSTIGVKMEVLGVYEYNVLIAAAIIEVILSFSIIKYILQKNLKEK
jgi:Kef-type K+ transport system membrane component KefB